MCYRLSYIIAKELLCVIDYYAFGTSMPGRKYESGLYRYGFNGKENSEDGDFGSQLIQDYGFRMYNPAIGKFLSVDPLTQSYPMLTPYQFASNSPIWMIDVDGLEGAPTNDGTNEGQRVSVDYLTGQDEGTNTINYVWHKGSLELGTKADWYTERKYQKDIVNRIASIMGGQEGLAANPSFSSQSTVKII